VGGGTWVLCDFGSATSRARVYSTADEIAAEEEVIRKHTTPAYRAPEVGGGGVGVAHSGLQALCVGGWGGGYIVRTGSRTVWRWERASSVCSRVNLSPTPCTIQPPPDVGPGAAASAGGHQGRHLGELLVGSYCRGLV